MDANSQEDISIYTESGILKILYYDILSVLPFISENNIS